MAVTCVILYVLATVHVAVGRSYMTSRPVVEPAPPRYDIIDLVRQDINYRFSDTHKRLTAIKDKQLQSCFVNDYDPQWNLGHHDKRTIVGRTSFEAANTPDKFYRLKKKAGDVIANMCRRGKIFWLANAMLAPPPLMIDRSPIAPPKLPSVPGNAEAPPMRKEPNNQGQSILSGPAIAQPIHNAGGFVEPQPDIRAPPQLGPEVIPRNSVPELRAPPPAVASDDAMPPPLQQDTQESRVPRPVLSAHVRTPPPLPVWHHQHATGDSPTGEKANAPPPLAQNPPPPGNGHAGQPEIRSSIAVAPPPLDNHERPEDAGKPKMMAPPPPDMRVPAIRRRTL